MVEQSIRNRQVVGSTPTLGSRNFLFISFLLRLISLLPLSALMRYAHFFGG